MRIKKIIIPMMILCVVLPSFEVTGYLQSLKFGGEIESNPFVVEGEEFNVFVECEGIGIADADVYLEREDMIYFHSKTNQSGYASFEIPEVNFSIPCKLRAEKKGYEEIEINVTILNRPRLHIICPKFVEEGEIAKISVIDDEMNYVAYAILSLNNEDVVTDKNGSYYFEVPQVGFPTPIKLSARKEGYEKSEDVEMWILDNRTSLLSAPLFVKGGESFGIHYKGEEKVEIYFNGTYFSGKEVVVEAPHVETTKSFQIKAYDENGFLVDYRFIVVSDNRNRGLLVSPDFVSEGDYFNVSLFSLEDGKGISDAEIRFGNEIGITDSEGRVSFKAPHVDNDYKLYQIECLEENISCSSKHMWIRRTGEYNLVIEGPSAVRSGENVSFSVMDTKGRRVFAIFSIENTTYFAWNGSVEIKIPYVNESKFICINVKSPGYAEERKIVYVRREEKKLFIDCPDSIEEGESLLIRVEDESKNPVEGACVWFNFREYQCDENGEVQLTAPDVLLSEKFLIYAEKGGYLPASKWITVASAGIGKKFMKLIAPLASFPLKKIQVKVINEEGKGIGGVDVKMQYESIVKHFETDENGSAYIISPPLSSDDFFILTASKSGYISSVAIVHLYRFEPTFTNLTIYTPRSSVDEGENFIVQVTDEDGMPVEGAALYVDGKLYPETSDENGVITCQAPYVKIDRGCFLYAVKEGYNFGYTWVEVVNSADIEEPIEIETNDTVCEGESFKVKITDLSGNPVEGIDVWFSSLKKRTDENGMVIFTAPSVERDSYVLLEVSSNKYSPCYKLIKVLDRYEEVALNISVPPRLMEGELIEVVVRDAYGYLVGNATVMLNGEIVGYTDDYGRLKIKLPEVDHDSIFDIMVVKSGYLSAHKEIEVKNKVSGFIEENWFLIPGILMIFLVAVLAYFYYRQNVV